MTDLDAIAEMLEEIVERETTRLHSSNEALTERTIKVLEGLSKLTDACVERRTKRPEPDAFKDSSTEELQAEFE